MTTIQKPAPGEYNPYAIAYIDLVPDDGLVLQHLADDLTTLKALVQDRSDEKLSTPCAPGEWTIKEILVHISDTERIFAYRALCIARNDTTPLPGFEQDDYIAASNANRRPIEAILEELTAVRQASLALFKSLDDDVFTRTGTASEYALSVRSALYQIVGHARHHINSIKENYGLN